MKHRIIKKEGFIMPITATYSLLQENIIDELRKANLYEGPLTCLLVIMSTNKYIRTAKDLANILSEYPGIGSKESALHLIKECEKNGLLKAKDAKYGLGDEQYYYQDNECFELFIEPFPNKIKAMIKECRKNYSSTLCVNVLGLLSGKETDEYINVSFHTLLNEAQKEILLPMLNTAANDSVIKILKNRASLGVSIKILLPDYERVVKKIRTAKSDSTKKWIEALSGIKNIEIRRYYKVEDSSIYSSVIIDKTICRICVFDSKREKSSNGTLIEVKKSGYDLNLTEMMIDRFNEIWFHSVPVDSSLIGRMLRTKYFWFILFLLLSILAFLKTDIDSTMHEIALNIVFAIGGLLLGSFYKEGFKFVEKIYKRLVRKGE